MVKSSEALPCCLFLLRQDAVEVNDGRGRRVPHDVLLVVQPGIDGTEHSGISAASERIDSGYAHKPTAVLGGLHQGLTALRIWILRQDSCGGGHDGRGIVLGQGFDGAQANASKGNEADSLFKSE